MDLRMRGKAARSFLRRSPEGIPIRVLLLLLLTASAVPTEATSGALPAAPLDPGLIVILGVHGTAVLEDGTICGLHGRSTVTVGEHATSPSGAQVTEVTTVTAIQWEGIGLTAGDTLVRLLSPSGEGLLVFDSLGDPSPWILLPADPRAGDTWSRETDGGEDLLSVVAAGRTFPLFSGPIEDCVVLRTERSAGKFWRSTVEVLAPGLGRVFLLEELGSESGWTVQVLHVLEAVIPPGSGNRSGVRPSVPRRWYGRPGTREPRPRGR